MVVTGIIMECNPFHEGHAYIIEEARRQTGADYILAAMSGDFVQRGEPAIFNKYDRAGEILQAGADLVLELPLYAACGGAEYFARGSISLLNRIGVVTDLCFGSESGDMDALAGHARLLAQAEGGAPDFRDLLREGLRAGMPYPAARFRALSLLASSPAREGAPPLPPLPATPNDLLGVEYCRALLAAGSAIAPHAIRRIHVPSATQRRQALLRKRTPGRPFPLSPDDFSGQLLYALRMEEDRLESYVDVSPEIADRIRRLLPAYRSFSAFAGLLKTKNITYTRASRCLLHILLRMEKDRLRTLQESGFALYARPLALRRSASGLLRAIRQNATIPFLPRLSRPTGLTEPSLSFLQEEIRAEELYALTVAAMTGGLARRAAGHPLRFL